MVSLTIVDRLALGLSILLPQAWETDPSYLDLSFLTSATTRGFPKGFNCPLLFRTP